LLAKPRTYRSIQLLRFLASLQVVLFHISILKDGYKGVDLFFVISGFVIYSSSLNKLGSGFTNAILFLLKRVIRIFVPYWSILLLIISTGYYYSLIGNLSLKDQLGSIFLLPGHIPFFEVTWSLSYELYFYFLFSLAILIPFSVKIRKWLFITAIIITGILLCLHAANYLLTNKALNFLAGNNIWEFLLGIIAALFCSKLVKKITAVSVVLFAIAIIGFTCIYIPYGNQQSHPVYGLAAFIIVLISVRLEDLKRLNIPRTFVILGDASYITYLVHVPIREVFFSKLQVTIFNKIIYIAIVYVASIAIHLVYEKRVLYKSNSILYKLFNKKQPMRKA